MTRSISGFPRRCCVSGCPTIVHNQRDADKRLFRFVRRAKAHSANPEFNELIERRFWEWITVLGQNPRNAKSLWICGKHFVTGRPAAPACHWETDWIPNRNLKRGKVNAERQRSNSVSNEALNRRRNCRTKSIENSSCLQQEHLQEEASLSNKEGPFCRLCLRKHVNLRPVFPSPRVDENHIVRTIELVASIRLEFEADYNSFICCDCLEKVEEFHRCREIWQSNDVLLRAFRDKESYIKPVPIESLMDYSQPNNETTDTFHPEDQEPPGEPIPIVAIPIEFLIEGTEPTQSMLSDENTWAPASDSCEHSNHVEEQQNIALPDYEDDTKQPIEPLSTAEPTCNEASVKNASTPPEEPDTDATEAGQKERLIKKLMKKIRRETLSPKKKKSKKSSKRIKKNKSLLTSTELIDLTDSDKG